MLFGKQEVYCHLSCIPIVLEVCALLGNAKQKETVGSFLWAPSWPLSSLAEALLSSVARKYSLFSWYLCAVWATKKVGEILNVGILSAELENPPQELCDLEVCHDDPCCWTMTTDLGFPSWLLRCWVSYSNIPKDTCEGTPQRGLRGCQ